MQGGMDALPQDVITRILCKVPLLDLRRSLPGWERHILSGIISTPVRSSPGEWYVVTNKKGRAALYSRVQKSLVPLRSIPKSCVIFTAGALAGLLYHGYWKQERIVVCNPLVLNNSIEVPRAEDTMSTLVFLAILPGSRLNSFKLVQLRAVKDCNPLCYVYDSSTSSWRTRVVPLNQSEFLVALPFERAVDTPAAVHGNRIYFVTTKFGEIYLRCFDLGSGQLEQLGAITRFANDVIPRETGLGYYTNHASPKLVVCSGKIILVVLQDLVSLQRENGLYKWGQIGLKLLSPDKNEWEWEQLSVAPVELMKERFLEGECALHLAVSASDNHIVVRQIHQQTNLLYEMYTGKWSRFPAKQRRWAPIKPSLAREV